MTVWKIMLMYVGFGILTGGLAAAIPLSYGWRMAKEEPEFGSMIGFYIGTVGIVLGLALFLGFSVAGFIHACVRHAR